MVDELDPAILKAKLAAPSLSAYQDDPEYVAAAKAADDLLARHKGSGDVPRTERRLLKLYSAQMGGAVARAKTAHDEYLAELGLLDHETETVHGQAR